MGCGGRRVGFKGGWVEVDEDESEGCAESIKEERVIWSEIVISDHKLLRGRSGMGS